MAEVCTLDHVAQRLIDERFPATRLILQSLKAQDKVNRSYEASVRARARAAPGSFIGTDPDEPLVKVVQRVIDNRYPYARCNWVETRVDPDYQESAGERTRSLTSSTPLRTLNRTNDPRWATHISLRSQTAPL
jgi:hypothetical protein